VRPTQVVFACGDGNFYATALAAGHFHTYALTVRLSRPVACVRDRVEFSRLAWTFAGARPAGVAASGTETLRCAFLKLKP
jgi:hypothetical protein